MNDFSTRKIKYDLERGNNCIDITYMIIYNISLNYMYSVVKLKRNRKQYKEETR